MGAELLRFPHKQIRAAIIKQYIEGKWDKVVCFSCGNAARALESEGVKVLHIGRHGVLEPKKWFTQAAIHAIFPGYFDATSGHLPAELMAVVGQAYKAHLGKLTGPVYVPSGSGETLVCLKLAYPDVEFVAVYNLDEATEYSPHCPLNPLVTALSKEVVINGLEWLKGRDRPEKR